MKFDTLKDFFRNCIFGSCKKMSFHDDTVELTGEQNVTKRGVSKFVEGILHEKVTIQNSSVKYTKYVNIEDKDVDTTPAIKDTENTKDNEELQHSNHALIVIHSTHNALEQKKNVNEIYTIEIHGSSDYEKSNQGYESDDQSATASTTKTKYLKSRRKRTQQRFHKNQDQIILLPLSMYPTKIIRTGYIANSRYIIRETIQVQKLTKFRERFFEYQSKYSCNTLDMTALKSVEHIHKDTYTDRFMVDIILSYCWPMPFPIIKIEDMFWYKDIIIRKRLEIENILSVLKNQKHPNSDFFEIRLLSLLAFTYIGEGKLGKAVQYLEEGSYIALALEPCEWTAWLFLGYAFYYITWGAKNGPDDCFKKALRYLERAFDHLQRDVEKGASLGIGNSLVLWWMFLIKSGTIHTARSVSSGRKHHLLAIQDRPFAHQYKIEKGILTDCSSVLQKFQEEAKVVETFPVCPKADDIIKIFVMKKDGILKKKEYIISLYHQLVADMGSEVPMYIQSMYKSIKRGKIMINVDADKVKQAEAFVKEKCPDVYYAAVIQFIAQKFRPRDLMKRRAAFAARPLQDERQAKLFTLESPIIVLTDEQRSIMKNTKNVTCFSDWTEKCESKINYGSIGGILQDKKTKVFYGTSANHCLIKAEGNEAYGAQVIDKNVYIELYSTTLQIDEIKIIGTKGFGILDSISKLEEDKHETESCGKLNKDKHEKETVKKPDKDKHEKDQVDNQGIPKHKKDKVPLLIKDKFGKYKADQLPHGVDIGIFGMNENILSAIYSDVFHKNINGDIVTLRMYNKESSDMIGKLVQKTGATTDKTEGAIVLVDTDFNVAGKICQGSFIVTPQSHSDDKEFASFGDSGSWVIDLMKDETEAEVYGIVHKVQDEYYHEIELDIDESDNADDSCDDSEVQAITFPHVAICLRMDNAIYGLNNHNAWDFELDIYNPTEKDSGYSTGGRQGSIDSEKYSGDMVEVCKRESAVCDVTSEADAEPTDMDTTTVGTNSSICSDVSSTLELLGKGGRVFSDGGESV